jgi:hypothetical protein
VGTLYMAIPKASHAIVEVATGTAIKTLLQVATPSTTDIRVHGWGVSFDGISATAAPGVLTLVDVDVAASVTTLTPEEWESDDAQASLCVGGASATGYNATAEGTIAGSRILDGQEVHPQTGYSVFFAEGRRPRVKPSRFLRVRALFAADVNSVPWVLFEEPA